jgi:hypothetical protein
VHLVNCCYFLLLHLQDIFLWRRDQMAQFISLFVAVPYSVKFSVIIARVNLHLTSHTCLIQKKWECFSTITRVVSAFLFIFSIRHLSKWWLSVELNFLLWAWHRRLICLSAHVEGSQFPFFCKKACKPYDIHFPKWIRPIKNETRSEHFSTTSLSILLSA